ncbi:DNA-binding protein YbiB [Affinibrenneria salicis]|uniref:DNA-binding protein YbiB n=1 Tax=Affinibrenneria salicis TaxID=2590031 RepID=A0A5J5G3K3_9GAMM|nr:DNA-binding protein YbiB [Affinibrenneria salicis]KAA9000613.1 DNA-binding protein YbiB [Affinibrenneria salicis]
MDYSKIIKEVGRGKNHARDLDQSAACELYRHMLDGKVPELELGGLLLSFRIKGEAEEEMRGFYQAAQERVRPLRLPAGRPAPVVVPTYNGARRQANLTPLLALLLARLGLPVLVHGVEDDPTRVTSAAIFQALGLAPARDIDQAQRRLDAGQAAFIPLSVLCPPLQRQLDLRWRLGVRNSSHTLAKLITPFDGEAALRLASVSHPEYVTRVATFFVQTGGRALLMQGTEGEVYASPQRCPQIHLIRQQQQQILLERQNMAGQGELAAAKDVETTARWTERCLAGELPVPQSIRLQLACCLVGAGAATSLEQAQSRLDQALS